MKNNRLEEDYLIETPIVNYSNKAVRVFCEKHSRGKSDIERVVSLYYAVRDYIRYDPYSIELSIRGLCASSVVETGVGWCVSKAVLFTALCRLINVPASLGFADVKNHLSTTKLREKMGTDVFLWHGYTSVLLNNRWVKATPAFNIELCDKFRILPLEFNGVEDSIYHPFDVDGKKHMEYLNFRGEYQDVPFDEMKKDFSEFYPSFSTYKSGGDFTQEILEDASKSTS